MKPNLPSLPSLGCCTRATVAMIAGTCFLSPGPALQARESEEAHSLSELERSFWYCDYTVSTRRVDMATGVACVAISDDLKARKFGGDFNALLAWWRLNKDAMYRTLDSAERSAADLHAPASSERPRSHAMPSSLSSPRDR